MPNERDEIGAPELIPLRAPKHDDDCGEWCNHCGVCGEGIVWGSLCRTHELHQGKR